MSKKTYLTIQETAAFLEMPIETVYKYARTKKMPASKVGRYWRFDRDQLVQWRMYHRSSSSQQELQIMVVDDEPLFRDLIGTWLRSMGHVVDILPDGEMAMDYLKIQQYDLVFLDLQMPKANGVEVLRAFRDLGPSTEFIIVTAHFESSLMDEALSLGTMTVLKKPFSRENLVQVVKDHQVRRAYT